MFFYARGHISFVNLTPRPGPGPGPGAHVRLDPRRLLSGTSTPVAMHFHKKDMEISYLINKI